MKMTVNLLLIIALSVICSCGGGGGGSDVSGAADVRINAEPRTIDTGDRIRVTLTVNDIHPNGIALKVRFPSTLGFVESSAYIDDDGDEIGIAPDVLTVSDNETYLVFYLRDTDFGNDERGDLIFEIQGLDEVEDAEIEVDPDVDDPLIDNSIEFSVDTPLFSAEDSIFVFVKG